MRDVRVDLTGTTDANGNASIVVPVPFTGAWYTVKFPLSLPAPAEWAILVSGTPLTYGRGRRVTLGPELIRDGEKVTISVTGGPPNAAIVGSMNGSAGTPDEMLVNFTPAPNTIALDSTAQRRALIPANNLFTVPGNGLAQTRSVPITGNVAAIRIEAQHALPLVAASTITYLVTGDQTGNVYWGDPVTGQTRQPANLAEPVDVAVDAASDSSVTIAATGGNGGGTWNLRVTGLTLTEVLSIRAQEPLTVVTPSPAPRQAPFSSVGIQGVAMTINTDFTILAGVAGLIIYLHDVHLNTNSSAFTSIELWDGPSASGTLIGVLANDGTAVGAVPMTWDGKGRPGTAGNALVGKPTNMSAGASIWGAVGLTQA